MLNKWREVTEREYHTIANMLPHSNGIIIKKLANAGIMTDIYNTVQKTNREISKEISGGTHNLLCHNHLRNVWVKNVLNHLLNS